jgi:hypothetical protein
MLPGPEFGPPQWEPSDEPIDLRHDQGEGEVIVGVVVWVGLVVIFYILYFGTWLLLCCVWDYMFQNYSLVVSSVY